MAAHITLTCDKCGRELDVAAALSVQVATGMALHNEGWQQVGYQIGRAEFTELRCPDCHLTPLNMDDQIITREPAYDHA